jgi:glutamate formiminotransferase
MWRRGEYELLKKESASTRARDPDFGPKTLGKRGPPSSGRGLPGGLQCLPHTADVRIAQAIAQAVRQSSGGYRYVKAMGICVAGQAQVSMNMTNFRARRCIACWKPSAARQRGTARG